MIPQQKRLRFLSVPLFWTVTGIAWLFLLLPLGFMAVEGGAGILQKWAAGPGDRLFYVVPVSAPAAGFWRAGGRTALVALTAAGTAMGLAVPVSFFLVKCVMPSMGLVWTGLLVLACVPGYVTVSGMVDLVSLAWFIHPGSPHRAVLGAGLVCGISYAPLAVAGSAGAWLRAGRNEEEAGLLAAPARRVWRWILLPMCLPGLAATGMVVAVVGAYDITGVDALAVRSWAEEIYLGFNLELDAGRAAFAALPLAFMALLGSAIALRTIGKKASPLLLGNERDVFQYPVTRGRWVVWIALALLAAFLFLPMGQLLLAGWSEASKPAVWKTVLRSALLTSGCVGAGALLAVFLALPLAWKTTRKRPVFTGGVATFALFLFVIPGPLLGSALACFWNKGWWVDNGLAVFPELVYDTPLVVVCLHAMQCLPPALFLTTTLFRHFPGDCFDAAATLGIPAWRAACRIALPIARKGLIAVWSVCYFLALRELGGLLLVAPPGHTFLAVRYATQIHFGVYADLAFLLVASMPVLLLPPASLLLWARREDKRKKVTT